MDDYEGHTPEWGEDYMLDSDVSDDFSFEGQELHGEDLGGLSITEESFNMQENMDDAAAEFLAGNVEQDNEAISGMSASALMEGRLGHMPHGVTNALKAVMGGGLGIVAANAVDEFRKLTGEDPRAFSRRIKAIEQGDVTSYGDNIKGTVVETSVGYSNQDVNTAIGLIGDASTAKYLNRGAGEVMQGNVYAETPMGALSDSRGSTVPQPLSDDEKDYRKKLTDSYGVVKEIAGMMVHHKVPEGNNRTNREEAINNALLNNIMNNVYSAPIKGPDGKMIFSGGYNNILLPNETGVMGTVATIGKGTGAQGTPFTSLEYSIAIAEGGKLHGNPDATRYQGDIAKSLGFGDNYSKSWEDFLVLNSRYKEAAKFIRESTTTEHDMNRDNRQRMTGYQAVQTEYREQASLHDEANVQGLGREQNFISGGASSAGIDSTGEHILVQKFGDEDRGFDPLSKFNYTDPNVQHNISGAYRERDTRAASARAGVYATPEERLADENMLMGSSTGSSKGGMYGLSQASDVDQFVEDRLNPEVTQFVGPITQRQAYARQRQFEPDQGSDAWLARRAKQDFTGTSFGILDAKNGDERLEYNLFMDRYNAGQRAKGLPEEHEGFDYKGAFTEDRRFVGNSATKEGNDFEHVAKTRFMERHGTPMGLNFEEAFFEDGSENLPGIGVSPDGRLYDAQGKSAGLVEFKVLTDTSKENALKKYYNQLQMQLAKTGEDVVHFYAIDKHDDSEEAAVYEVVRANPQHQKMLVDRARAAKNRADKLTTPEAIQLMKNARYGKTSEGVNKRAAPAGKVFNSTTGDEVIAAFDPNNIGSGPDTSTVRGEGFTEQFGGNLPEQFEELGDRLGDAMDGFDDVPKSATKLTKAFDKVSAAARDTGKVMEALNKAAELLTKGNEDGMSEGRVAASIGFETKAYSGILRVMKANGMKESDIDDSLESVADFTRVMQTATRTSPSLLRAAKLIGSSAIPGVREAGMIDPTLLRGQSPQFTAEVILDKMQSIPSASGKIAWLEANNLDTSLSFFNGSPSSVGVASYDIGLSKLRSTYEERQAVSQKTANVAIAAAGHDGVGMPLELFNQGKDYDSVAKLLAGAGILALGANSDTGRDYISDTAPKVWDYTKDTASSLGSQVLDFAKGAVPSKILDGFGSTSPQVNVTNVNKVDVNVTGVPNVITEINHNGDHVMDEGNTNDTNR